MFQSGHFKPPVHLVGPSVSFSLNTGSGKEVTLCSAPLPVVGIATQALLKSLCYDPRGQDTVQQTKSGLPYYDGNPYDFEQWHFVVMGKYDAYASKRDRSTRTGSHRAIRQGD